VSGQAAFFSNRDDGTSSYITIPNTAGSSPLSLAFWVQLTAEAVAYGSVVVGGFTTMGGPDANMATGMLLQGCHLSLCAHTALPIPWSHAVSSAMGGVSHGDGQR